MRLSRIAGGLALATALLSMGNQVFAQVGGNPTITVNENGVGSLGFPGGAPTPLQGVLAPDPGPGGLVLSLTYNLLGPPGLVAGDLLLIESGASGVLSDLIRFNPAGTGTPGYPASLVFYSDNTDGGDAPADRGFPTLNYANQLSFLETGPEFGPNGFTYTPTANQPVFVPGFGVTYVIRSDLAAVPEPSTIVMSGLVALLGLGYAWRRKPASA
jgi:hypothetical protein